MANTILRRIFPRTKNLVRAAAIAFLGGAVASSPIVSFAQDLEEGISPESSVQPVPGVELISESFGNEYEEYDMVSAQMTEDGMIVSSDDILNLEKVFHHPDDDPGYSHSYFQEHEFEHEHAPLGWQIWEHMMEALELPHEPLVHLSEMVTGGEHDGTVFTDPDFSHTSDIPIGVQPIMSRPPLPLGEYGQKFLGQGTIQPGIELPTGAVWRPAVWIFGMNRFGISYRDDQNGGAFQAGRNFGSVVNRLMLFGQINLTGTEHFFVSIRPTDQEEGPPLLMGREYTSYFWKTHTQPGVGDIKSLDGSWQGDFQSLYFEGQFDEIFPFVDPYDTEFLDYGFSVGRQPMSFQRGLMVNEDMIDAVTVTRNTLYGNGNLNLRITGVFAWDRVTRVAPAVTPGSPAALLGGSAGPQTDAKMYGIFTESDFKFNTMNLDVGFMDDPDPAHRDSLVCAISSTQRLVGYHNTYNSRFHLLASFPTEGEGVSFAPMASTTTVSGQGELFFAQISMTPHRGEDLIYWNTFWAIDQFSTLARAPQAGPLGDTGLLFAAAGLGLYAPVLSTVSNSSVGTAIGYQLFFDTKEKQIIWEFGGREGKGGDDLEIAGAMQYQQAFGKNWIWLVTGFLSGRKNTDGLSNGLRTELQLFF